MRPPVAVAAGAIVRSEREILLIRRGRPPEVGRWSVPGGRVEAGERLRDAVRREVREEAGIDVDVGALIGVVERSGPGHHYVVADFEATASADAIPRAGDDADDVAWVPVAELGTWELVEGLADFFADHGVV